jgi:hypothetical protein
MSDVQNYIETLSDDDLINLTNESVIDLATASTEFPNSEYHSNCYAAFCMLSIECANRNLKLSSLSTVH